MKKLMRVLFLSCLKATELIEKRMHFHLSFSEKIRLNMHKMMCDACTKYETQSRFIENVIHDSLQNSEADIDLKNIKKSILSKIEDSK